MFSIFRHMPRLRRYPVSGRRDPGSRWRSAALAPAEFITAAAIGISIVIGLSTPPAAAQDGAAEDHMISPTDLRGNERIWGLILYATEEEIDGGTGDTGVDGTGKQFRATAVNGVMEKVRKALPGYKGFKILGAHDQQVLREYATWITPSADFFLAIDSKGRASEGDGVNVYLQLWSRQIEPGKEDKVLLKSDVVLKRSSPLVIEGPKWRDGRVVFVLTLEYSELFNTDQKPEQAAGR